MNRKKTKGWYSQLPRKCSVLKE